MNKKHAIFNMVTSLLALTIQAQLPGFKDSIFSNVLNEERNLQIQLPKEYKQGSGEKYSVLYLLDGEWNAGLLEEVSRWSQQWGFTPPIIMVGIANVYPRDENQRGRDLTPTSTGGNSGGGPKFLSFIKNELIPYINKAYPSNGSDILFGHSLGGMFVLYTLFSEPRLFDSYIAADPSLWWDNGYMLRLAAQKLPQLNQVKSLFITGRPGRPYKEMKIDSMEYLLKRLAPAGLQWKIETYPDETHVSQQYKSAYDGLRYSLAPLFKNDRIRVDPMDGIIVEGKPFHLSCYNVFPAKCLRYTLDGRAPGLKSASLYSDNELTFTGNTTLNIKSFFPGNAADRSLTINFVRGKALRTFKKPARAKKGAFNYVCYSDSTTSRVITSGVLDPQKDINRLCDADSFYTVLSGYLETEKAGYYVFEINGEEGNKLWVGNKLLLDLKAGNDYQSYIIPLEKGFYPIRFQYLHRKSGRNFDFSYIIPGALEDGPIALSLMYYIPGGM